MTGAAAVTSGAYFGLLATGVGRAAALVATAAPGALAVLAPPRRHTTSSQES